MQRITVTETIDGKLFKDHEEASHHEEVIILVTKIIKLLGGTNNDICPSSSDFSNGDGYYSISQADYTEAEMLTETLLKWTDQETYSITSRACYDNQYTGPVGRVMACVFEVSNGYRRVGQPYYAQNSGQVGNIVYNPKG